MRQKEQML